MPENLATPKLRFPGFSDDWERKNIGEVTSLFSRRNKTLIDAPVYSVTNYAGFVLQTTHFNKVVAGDDLKAYKIIQKDDFAYNPARVNVGSIARFKEDIGIISSLYVCFRCKNEYLIDAFMDFFLQRQSTKYYINSFGEGGVRIYLWYPLFSLIKIILPSIVEQQKITGFLTAVDERISLMEKRVELLKKYKKGVMQKIFTQQFRFNDENGKQYPDWQVRKVGDISIINPKVLSLPNEFTYIDLESVSKGKLLTYKRIKASQAPSRAQRLLKNNDILFQTVRPYQRNNFFFDLIGDYVASTGYAQIRFEQCPRFMYQLIHSDSFVSRVLDYCTGTNYPAINSAELRRVTVSLPKSTNEQKKIAAFLSALDYKLGQEQESLSKTEDFKRFLIQNMYV